MTAIMKLLYNEWANALGWTLLHSIWQSMVILLAVGICLRLIPVARSKVRYAVACCGMFMVAAASVVTFQFLHSFANGPIAENTSAASQGVAQLAFSTPVTYTPDTYSLIGSSLTAMMPMFVALWALGFLFFTIRIFSGLIYTNRIRSSAVVLTNEWADFINASARQLGITRPIRLAESSLLSAPVVIGYLKPVILTPLGMISGLTTEQLETVFLHELAHIRRHDYLINLLQSVIEAIFFFNPFMWVLSRAVRKERECCCDDLVIRQHGGDRAYANALVRLAEARLRPAGFALSIAEDKNQLLYRIKRIMERSGKTYSQKSRFIVPVVLLVAALLCISWLGTGEKQPATPLQAQDTIPAPKKGSASFSRRSIITLDENGKPHEEVVENFEGDESLRPLLQGGLTPMSPLPGIHGTPMTPGMPLPGMLDTIPSFGFQDMGRWEDFARAFEENFRERFEMLDGFQDADSAGFRSHFRDFTWPDLDSLGIPDHAMRAFRDLDLSYGDLNENLQRLKDLNMDRFEDFGRQFEDFGQRTSRYQDVLRDELTKDGYLGKDEPIESLEWNNDNFKVNGKSIKKSDLEKYNKINEEYLGVGGKVKLQ